VSELREVLAGIESLHARGQRMALATIVAVRGSTYRRPGARLLVSASGDMVGDISGGCLEGDLAEVAQVVMVAGTPRIVSFDLTSDDEAVWGWGLGCNGAIEVFVEPAEKALQVAGALRRALEDERPLAAVTVLASSIHGVEQGDRLLIGQDGAQEGSLADPVLEASVRSAALEQLASDRSEVRTLPGAEGEVRAFVEVLEPPLRLLMCGAGHDAIPLVRAAAALGWKVEVIDDRSKFLTSERFPGAARFVHVGRPEEAAAEAGVDERTHVMVMSHNYLRDLDYVRGFLGTPIRYLGMLGPRVRTDRLLGELRQLGVEPSPQDLAKMHGPAGLDVGSETPEEIAAAVVAEILAVLRSRAGGFLRHRHGPIHDRTEDRGAWR
jgi:xanthine dehydrogenase accessory factor